MSLFDLSGKTAIVTGGGKGIGRQMAQGLAEAGASLVLCARNAERCEQAAAELEQVGVRAIGLGCDIRHAHRLSCADGLNLADPPVTPVGPACSICPRVQCPFRATAPAGRALTVSADRKTISPYPFFAG